jgi:cbb3-type cytochrome oxidase maturation protein
VNVLFLVIPLALFVVSGAVAAFVWVVRSGQLDDVDTPPRRILFDDPTTHTSRTSPTSPTSATSATSATSPRGEVGGVGSH